MNPATAMWINLILTAVGGAATAVSASDSGGASTWAAAGVTIIGALNSLFHGISTAQPGPLNKK